MRRSAIVAGMLTLAAALPACAQDGDVADRPDAVDPAAPTTYDLIGRDGNSVGRIELTDGARGVLLQVRAENLEAGAHGLHVHETGVCQPPFRSAGGHYNPDGRAHGFLSPDGPHAGDLTNLVVGEGQSLTLRDVWLPGLSVERLTDDDGTAVVIHSGPDDYLTDPAGAAGERVACAAIVAQ